MEKITAVADLKNTIQQLEIKQAEEWLLLKEQFLNTYESLKPLNVLKSTLKEASRSVDIKNNVIGSTIGLTAGYLTKVLLVGASLNPIKVLIGSLLQVGVSNVVAKNPQWIKSLSSTILNLLNRKKEIKTHNI